MSKAVNISSVTGITYSGSEITYERIKENLAAQQFRFTKPTLRVAALLGGASLT